MSVELQHQIDELKQRITQFEAEHAEHRKVHISRKGPEGGRGERGETGPTGPSADPQEVATLAAELVKKSFRYETLVAKFQTLLSELEGEIVAVKASLNFAVIEELRLAGYLDANGNAVPGPAGADSQVPGPQRVQGEQALQGTAGKNGVDVRAGRDGSDGQSIVGP